MAPLEILEFPDPRLRSIASPVKNVNSKIVTLADRMLAAMYEAPGIGLAATQVNFHQRLIVIDVSDQKNKPLILINPVITEKEGEIETDEGCLSVPGFFEPIQRFDYIQFNAINREGEAFSMEATGILSVCIQHEMDHLEGKLFVDYLSTTKRQSIRRKLQKMQKQQI